MRPVLSTFSRRAVVLAGVAALGLGLVATSAAATVPARPVGHVAPAVIAPAGGTTHYAVNRPACATPADPAAIRCFAVKRVDVAKGTTGAYSYVQSNALSYGPAGGYTPNDLATAYKYNPNVNRSNQTVAIIDWYDDPVALKDLNAFDAHYGLKKETATSFRKVNQAGKASPLPMADAESSIEIALDIESVRAVCHTCRILLVEASNPTDTDLAAAENMAVHLGATEISNSFGEPERAVPASIQAAYNHPGVVITASTGDDGWYGWDYSNDPRWMSDGVPEFPSTSPNVVSVGGTALGINNDGSRYDEVVWNENGPDDSVGVADGPKGASGGGCSKIYAAPAWQLHQPGYTAAGCNGKRLAADISAIADPQYGFDVLVSNNGGWNTYGGTSLAAPVTAALYALAGGAGGARYPAASLYVHGAVGSASLFDVTKGGNGFCAGDSVANCQSASLEQSGGVSRNPNKVGAGDVDCSFPHSVDNTHPTTAFSSECNAVAGFDGPSGLGTPASGSLFNHTNPGVTITRPALKLKTAATFTARATETVAGTTVARYAWTWGDGTTSAVTTPTAKHAYAKAGRYTVSLTVLDNRYQTTTVTTAVAVGLPAAVHFAGPATLHVNHGGTFSSAGTTDPNTGGKIASVLWNWGDGHATTGASARHGWAKVGSFKVTETVVDNAGVRTAVSKTVKIVR